MFFKTFYIFIRWKPAQSRRRENKISKCDLEDEENLERFFVWRSLSPFNNLRLLFFTLTPSAFLLFVIKIKEALFKQGAETTQRNVTTSP